MEGRYITRILNMLNPLSTTGTHRAKNLAGNSVVGFASPPPNQIDTENFPIDTKVNRQSRRLFFFGLTLAVIILLLYAGRKIFVRNEAIAAVVVGIGLPLWNLLAAAALFYAARQAAPQSQARWAWQLLAAFPFTAAVGELMVLANTLVHPIPELLMHSVFLCAYPFAIAGVLLLPTKAANDSTWLETALDMLIVLLTATLALWYYWLVPMVAAMGSESIGLQLQVLAYPVGHLLLLWALFVLIYRQVD